jgi:hypothetical protein
VLIPLLSAQLEELREFKELFNLVRIQPSSPTFSFAVSSAALLCRRRGRAYVPPH